MPVLDVTILGLAPFILNVVALVPVIVALPIVNVPLFAPIDTVVADPPTVIEVCVESFNTAFDVNTEILLILYVLLEAMFQCSDEVQLALVLSQIIVLSVAPFSVIPPPSAVESVGVLTEPSSRFLSSTVTVVELTVVVVPLTIKLPVTVRLFPTVTVPLPV